VDDVAVINASPLIFLARGGQTELLTKLVGRVLIPQARPVIEALIRGGMYLSRPVLDESLQRVGE
jgi:predicted nucleic acid-binding protein